MVAEKRRQKILDELNKATGAISASILSRQLNVSRQIIVGDIAILRAAGNNILATPRGYILPKANLNPVFKIACKHDFRQMAEELNIIVDYGGKVLDVIVEHPIYGELHGNLQLENRMDVAEFLENIENHKAPPLSSLTDGVHLHTISCKDEKVLALIKENLCAAKILFDK